MDRYQVLQIGFLKHDQRASDDCIYLFNLFLVTVDGNSQLCSYYIYC